MTKRTPSKNDRVLAIAPSSRGFGFAVMEGGDTLVDWGVRSVVGDKNADALKKAEAMFALYKPTVLVLGGRFRKRFSTLSPRSGPHQENRSGGHKPPNEDCVIFAGSGDVGFF